MIDQNDIEKYRRRYKISKSGEEADGQRDAPEFPASQIVKRWRPVPMDITQMYSTIEIPERILYNVDSMIRKSFGIKEWYFLDKDRLIESSEYAHIEKGNIMSLLSGIDLGCAFAQAGDSESAVHHWCQASLQLESLLKGRFHDIIPNLICKLNDLLDRGFSDVAEKMIDHISKLCSIYLPAGYPIAAIFQCLNRVDLAHLPGLESRLLGMYHNLFEYHVGGQCYNTFVMNINAAKRILERYEWTDIDMTLPALEPLELAHGLANCRSLDVLRMKIETLYHRGQYLELIPTAQLLKNRADTKRDDPWQRSYFMIKALYYGGRAHVILGNDESARLWLGEALFLEDIFTRTVDGSGQFTSEKVLMQDTLAALGNQVSLSVNGGRHRGLTA